MMLGQFQAALQAEAHAEVRARPLWPCIVSRLLPEYS